MLAALLGLVVLAFKVSGLTQLGNGDFYSLTANFSNIGGLKVRAPVRISGVTIGRVADISLNRKTFQADVTLQIKHQYDDLPVDTSASIYTEGLLGANYVSLSPGFSPQVLKPKGKIQTTHSALVLENLIGQIIYSLKNKKDEN